MCGAAGWREGERKDGGRGTPQKICSPLNFTVDGGARLGRPPSREFQAD